MKGKIKNAAVKIVNKTPTLLALYLLYYIGSYLAKTLLRPHSGVYLSRVSNRLLVMLANELKFQADDNNRRLIAAYLPIDRDLSTATKAHLDLVSENPDDYPEAYFQTAHVLYFQGQYRKAMDEYYAKGLSLLDKEAKNSGLDLLETRFIGQEWSSIGHLIFIESLIKLQKLDLLSPEKRVVYMRKNYVSNPCYLNYLSEHIEVFCLDDEAYSSLSGFAEQIFEHVSCFKLRQGFTNLYSALNLAGRSWEAKGLSPLLKLKDSDRERGLQVFNKLSIPNDAWFVTLHVREGNAQQLTRSNANAKIETYLKAIQAITARGGWVIRMGHPGMTPLPKMERVVDYANSEFKSDWMDVFLWASCRFLIGSSSGPLGVPPTFGIPVLYTNCPHIGINLHLPQSLVLPKLYYSNTEKRFFTFREMLDSALGWTVARVFDGIDCTITDNTPEEIEAAVLEMLEAEEMPETYNQLSELQSKFNSLRKEYGNLGQVTISESFARKHHSLI